MELAAEIKTGIVVIGRNEGERLKACFDSLPAGYPVVYVDSASTDGSVALASQAGHGLVELSADQKLSAARARNAGLKQLVEMWPSLTAVQFLDGDCELFPDWLATAEQALEQTDNLAAVCGQRYEKYPDHSIYNRLCAIEWDTPVGDALAVGGDSLMRIGPVLQAGGFDEAFVGGEEPELCYRMRQAGWKIARLDVQMTLHDAAMDRWQQWWARNARSGGAFAQSAQKHGRGPERFGVRASLSIWLYGAILPLLALALAPLTGGFSVVALFVIYLVQTLRISRDAEKTRGLSRSLAWRYGASIVLGKFPHLAGQLRFWLFGRTDLVEKTGVGS